MTGRHGFTLLEVVVAGGLLAIGVLSLTTLQAQALETQRRVAVVRQLVSVAEAQLYLNLALSHPVGGICRGAEAARLDSCMVETEACAVSTAAICAGSGSSRATRVTVLVERRGQRFSLSAVHAWFGG